MELRKCECGCLPELFSTFYEIDGETWWMECIGCDRGFVTEDLSSADGAVQAWNEGKVE